MFLDFESQMKAHSVCVHWNHLINRMLESQTQILITDYNHPKWDNQITSKPLNDYNEFQRIFVINELKFNKSFVNMSSTIFQNINALRRLCLQFKSNRKVGEDSSNGDRVM